MTDLHLQYRPKLLKNVIGQNHVTNSIQELFNSGKVPHAFLFIGNSGTGKTSLSRIISNMLNSAELVEVDGATYTGIDDMRIIADGLKYKSLQGNGIKFLIIDEAHSISQQSWKSWLKFIEEPPEHVYICFCTTEIEKVPLTIQTRCHKYTLQDLSVNNLVGLIEQVSEIEKIDLPDKAAFLIAKESYGSARQALVYLSMVRMCSTLEEVQKILRTSEDKPEVIDLCRAIVGSRYYESNAYTKVIQLLSKLKDVNPLSIKIQVMNYLTGCILKSKTENEAVQFLHMLEIFDRPVDQQTGFSSIVLAVSEIFLKR